MAITTTQASMTFPGEGNLGKSVSLVPWKSDSLLMPLWPSRAAYEFIPAGSVFTVSGTVVPQPSPAARAGFVGAVPDGAGNAWLLGYTGPVTFMANTGVGTLFPIPSGASGEIFAGAAYCSGAPYFGATSGNLYTNSAGTIVEVTGGFGELTREIASDGTKLYGVLPGVSGVSHLGVMTLASPTSGTVSKVALPIAYPSVITASASGVAIGGWAHSVVASGASSIVLAPAASGLAVMANTSANAITLLTGTDPAWVFSAPVSGTGAPVDLAWSGNGTQVLVTDPTHNEVQIFTLTLGTLASSQILSVSGATHIGVTPTTGVALVTQPSKTNVSILSNVANTWSVAEVVSGVTANSLVILSDTEAAVGSPSGITWLNFISNTWQIEKVVSGLAFTPVSLATDGNGTVFGTGTFGVSGGVVAAAKTGTPLQASWTGSGNAAFYRQGQIAVADNSNNKIRVYGQIGASLTLGATASAPSGVSYIGQTGISVWLCGTSAVWQDRFTAPYRLVPYQQGLISIYNGSSFNTVSLGVEHQPSALTWGPSGVWAATIQDDIFVVSASGTILVQQTIIPQAPQVTGTPLGVAALLFHDGGLVASSAMNNGLISLVAAQASGAPVAPSNLILSVISVSNSTVGLAWQAPNGTPPFRFQTFYRVGPTGSFLPYGASGTSLTTVVSGLSGTTTYNFAVSGINDAGNTLSNIVSASTQTSIGAPVLTGAPAPSGSGTVENLTWTTPAGSLPINFQVLFRQVSLGGAFVPLGGIISQNSLPVGNLTPGVQYQFKVNAQNTTGNMDSNVWTETMPTAPTAPVLTVVSTGMTTASASWTGGTGATSFQLTFRASIKGTFQNYGNPSATSPIAVSGLSPLQSYQYQLAAIGIGGTTLSAVVSPSGSASAPGQVSAVLNSITNSSAILTFSVSGGTAPIFYQAGISQGNSGTYSLFGNPVSGVSGIMVTGLIPVSPYGFEIIASNGLGSATSPSVTGTTFATASVSGSQTAVSSPSGIPPYFVGPTGVVIAPGMTLPITGVRIISDPWGAVTMNVNTNYVNATVYATVSGVPCAGAGTGGPGAGGMNIGINEGGLTVSQFNAGAATLTYTAPPSGVTSDVINLVGFDANSSSLGLTIPPQFFPTMNIAVSIVSGAISGTAGAGYGVYHSTGGGVSGSALLLPQGYLATLGNQIVDPNNGNLPVRIAAAAYYGMETGNASNSEATPSALPFGTWQVNYKTILNAAVAMGFNAIRWEFADACLAGSSPQSVDGSNYTINTTLNPSMSGQTVLQNIDTMVAYAGSIGLKIWFARMWQNPTTEQTTLFYGTPSGIGSLTNWTQPNVIADMVMLATRYANNPTVIGIELNNEVFSPPCTFGDGNTATDIQLFWTNAGNAILNVNPNLLIICQGYQIETTGGTTDDLSGVATFPVTLTVPNRVVYAIHTYPPSVNGSLQAPSVWDPSWGFIYTTNTAPILITEFGRLASDTSTASAQWLDRILSYCTAGVSGSVSGIPTNGYPPSMCWFDLNASGPGQGDGAGTPNQGMGLLNSSDWSTPLPGQLAPLLPIMFYAKS